MSQSPSVPRMIMYMFIISVGIISGFIKGKLKR